MNWSSPFWNRGIDNKVCQTAHASIYKYLQDMYQITRQLTIYNQQFTIALYVFFKPSTVSVTLFDRFLRSSMFYPDVKYRRCVNDANV
ncbi:unnamed protein product [Ceratitis capitata]|uniref:(Mediterranean fruit fly) hypothetical protein n=1 Tax=Ceratitis capitata TaxID=7213 RepID=A0A811UVK2_CERCA|nr:unnamed protein product [Ceratitis capitata]